MSDTDGRRASRAVPGSPASGACLGFDSALEPFLYRQAIVMYMLSPSL